MPLLFAQHMEIEIRLPEVLYWFLAAAPEALVGAAMIIWLVLRRDEPEG
jgi:hypothetical protein